MTLACFAGCPAADAYKAGAKETKHTLPGKATVENKDKTEPAAPPDRKDSTGTTPESESINSWASAKPQTAKTDSGKPVTTFDTSNEAEYIKLLRQDRLPSDLKFLGESVVKIRKQVTDNPNLPFLRYRLGTFLYLIGDLEGAATELSAAINLNAASASARAQLGKVLELAGRHMEALTQFRRAVEISPNQADIHFLFGESLAHGGNMQEAINEYRRAVALKPSAESLAALSECQLLALDNNGAMESSRAAVSLDATLARAQVALTNALLKAGDKAAAQRTARQAMLLSPNLPDSHLALGRCLFAGGDSTGAVEEFKQAVGIDPLNPNARNDLGYVLYNRGEIIPAIAEFRIALRISPRFTEARNNLEVAIHRLCSGK